MAELDGVKLSNKVITEHLQDFLPVETDRLFVFELGQLVYLMVANKVYSAKVTSRAIIENISDEVSIVNPNRTPFGRSGIFYSVSGEEYEEHMLFPSKEDLLESM